MDSQTISRKDLKRRRRAISPSDQNQRLPREKVYIPDDTWLEALKFLTCPEWSQKRFVSCQINGIADRNISRLPKMVLDKALIHYFEEVDEEILEELPVNKCTIVAFDTIMQEEQSTEWFKNRGFTLDAPVAIPPENALLDAHKWTHDVDSNVHLVIFGVAQEKIPLSKKEKQFPWFDSLLDSDEEFLRPLLYYAQFNPVINQYSWDYLAQFLKLLYHPTSYIKEIDMHAVNQIFVDSLKYNVDNVDNRPRYIQCGSFVLRDLKAANVVYISDMLKWLARNVRAETIHIPMQFSDGIFVLLSNFVFDEFGAKHCASKKMKIHTANGKLFLNTLIEKFYTIPLVESAIPMLRFEHRRKKLHARLGTNLIAREVDSEGADALYMISNERNQMRISFGWKADEEGRYISTCRVRIYSI